MGPVLTGPSILCPLTLIIIVLQDCNGHGTHVAGTAAGTTYGIASNATIHSVRVFGCTGGSPKETIIAGQLFVC